MKQSQFTERQIITILKEHEQGEKVVEIARRHKTQKRQFIVGRLDME